MTNSANSWRNFPFVLCRIEGHSDLSPSPPTAFGRIAPIVLSLRGVTANPSEAAGQDFGAIISADDPMQPGGLPEVHRISDPQITLFGSTGEFGGRCGVVYCGHRFSSG